MTETAKPDRLVEYFVTVGLPEQIVPLSREQGKGKDSAHSTVDKHSLTLTLTLTLVRWREEAITQCLSVCVYVM